MTEPAHDGTDPLEELRAICLDYPEAIERAGVVEHTFCVRGKIFSMYLDGHHGDGRLAMWCKAPRGAQEVLVTADPERSFVPPYVGHHGWIGVRLEDEVDWDEVRALVDDSYRMTASKRQIAQLDAR